MLTSLALLALAVSPGKMAFFSLEGNEFTTDQRAAWAEQVEEALAAKHYDALTPKAMPPGLLGQARSCGADLACLGAVAEALETTSLLMGSVSRAGDQVQVELRVHGTGDTRVLATSRSEAAGVEQVPEALDAAVTALVVQFEAYAAPPADPPRGLGARFWAPVISGVVVMGAGGYVLGSALVDLDAVKKARGVTLSEEEAGVRAYNDIVQRNVGIVGMSFGAAAIVGGVILGCLTPRPAPITVGAAFGPSSGVVQVKGSF